MSSLIPNLSMPNPAAPLQVQSGGEQPIDLATSHKVLVGLAVLVVVGMILTEGAGHSKDAATVIILLLVGVFLMEGMTHAARFQAFAMQNPWNPL